MKKISLLLCLAILSPPTALLAQSEDSYRFVLETDSAFVAAMILYREPFAPRYLALGVRVALTTSKPIPWMVSDDIYAIDCDGSKQIQVIRRRINRSTSAGKENEKWADMPNREISTPYTLTSIPYTPLSKWIFEQAEKLRSGGIVSTTPDGLAVAVEYACQAVNLNVNAREDLAETFMRTAGLPDLKDLECSYSMPDGQRKDVSIGFSASRRYVRWDGDWMNHAFVRDEELGFSNPKWSATVNRRTGVMDIKFVRVGGIALAGTCEVAGKTPKKF